MSLDKILISKYITNIHLLITHPDYLSGIWPSVLQPPLRHTIIHVFASPPEHLLPLSHIIINFSLITYHSSLFGMIYLSLFCDNAQKLFS